MKKWVIVVLEVETEDEINFTDDFIKNDIEQELNCASNMYEVISIQTEVLN